MTLSPSLSVDIQGHQHGITVDLFQEFWKVRNDSNVEIHVESHGLRITSNKNRIDLGSTVDSLSQASFPLPHHLPSSTQETEDTEDNIAQDETPHFLLHRSDRESPRPDATGATGEAPQRDDDSSRREDNTQ